MVPILELTNSTQVRSLLGVDEEELADQVFASSAVEHELLMDILTWLPSGEDLDAIITAGVSATSRGSDAQLKYLRLMGYAKGFCAHYFVMSEANWRLIRLTDGNVDERRKERIDTEQLRRDLEQLMSKHKEAFLELTGDSEAGVSTQFSLMGSADSTFDPVTG